MKKIVYLLPFILVACSSSTEVAFEKASGKINKVKVNDRFHINLSEDHKVGSGLWSIVHDFDEAKVEYVNSVYNAESGGSVDFNFKALEKGKTEIHLIQSFAQDTLLRSSFVVEVE